MAIASRTVVPPPSRLRRPRVRTLATALCGGLIGLLAGTAFVALAPQVGRSPTVDPSPPAPGEAARHRPHRGHPAGVSAVLMPAAEAGVRPLPARDADAEGGAP